MYREMDMRYWLKETEREINHLALNLCSMTDQSTGRRLGQP